MSVEVYSIGVCYCSVCASAEMSAVGIEESVNEQKPTGLDSPWRISKNSTFACGTPMPAPCDNRQDHKHWLLEC